MEHCIIQISWKIYQLGCLSYYSTLFSYKKRPNSVVCEMKRLATFHKRVHLRYPALLENNRLDPKKTTLCTHAFSRHVDVCCRRDIGAEYISANEKLFYISYHMTEWIERVIFSEKNTSARRLNFFLESVKVSKEQIIVQRVTNAKRNKILFLAILGFHVTSSFSKTKKYQSLWSSSFIICKTP